MSLIWTSDIPVPHRSARYGQPATAPTTFSRPAAMMPTVTAYSPHRMRRAAAAGGRTAASSARGRRLRPVFYTLGSLLLELQEVSPRPGRTTVVLGLRALCGLSDLSYVGDDGLDASPPVADLGPAPCHRIRGCEQ